MNARPTIYGHEERRARPFGRKATRARAPGTALHTTRGEAGRLAASELPRRARRAAICFLLALAALDGCSSQSAGPREESGEGMSEVMDTGAFRHDQHLALVQNGVRLSCGDCHRVKPESKFATERPGWDNHAPCDGCHEKAYYQAPGALCEVCHASIDPFTKGNSPLKPYPRQQGRAQLVSQFNHKTHLARSKDRIQEGGEFVCEACHLIANPESAYASLPTHETCAFCHASVAIPRMASCDGCHAEDGPTKGRKFITNDVRFTHGKHRSDAAGKRIDCRLCHYAVVESTRASELNLPIMKDCAQCHENAERTPERVRITNCGVCHTGDVNKVDLPGDHTASRVPVWPQLPGALYASAGSGPAAKPKRELDLFPKWDLSSGLPSFLAGAGAGGAETSTGAEADRTSARMGEGEISPSPSHGHEQPSAGSAVGEGSAGDRGAAAERNRSINTERAIASGRGPARHASLKSMALGAAGLEDHTPLFRTRHAKAASDQDAKCHYCHSGLSGSTRDNCRECHAISRPKNHTLRWRTVGHGRVASQATSRCATCHEVDYCTECHSITPTNHFPLTTFRVRHNRSARVNPRACLTCHSFESTCAQCHGLPISAGESVTRAARSLERRP